MSGIELGVMYVRNRARCVVCQELELGAMCVKITTLAL